MKIECSHLHRSVHVLLIIIFLSFTISSLKAQSVTFNNVPPLAGGGTTGAASYVSGNVFNLTTREPILLQNVRGSFGTATGKIMVWYRPTKISGQPIVGASAGWLYMGSATMTGLTSVSTSPIVQTVPVPLSINMNPGDTFGFLIEWEGIVYSTTNTTIPTFTNGTVTIIADPTCAYAVSSGSWITPRQINGGVVYKLRKNGFNNASVTALSPGIPFIAGSYVVKARIANSGRNALTSVNVNWSLNGITQTSVLWTGSLDTVLGNSPSDTMVTLGTVAFLPAVTRNIKVWTSSPNTVTDTLRADDTLSLAFRPALNGNYTVGGTTPDFATPASAAVDLNIFGVSGPVLFNIRNGTYTGQVTIGNIPGASPINRITFQSQSNNRDLVVLSNTSTSYREGVLKLYNASYCTFRAITINQTGTGASVAALSMAEFALQDSFDNCAIATPSATNSGAYAAYINSGRMEDLVIRKCLMSGGHTGLYVNGALGYGYAQTSKKTTIEGNAFQSNRQDAFYLVSLDTVKFINNHVNFNGASVFSYAYIKSGREVLCANNVFTNSGSVVNAWVDLGEGSVKMRIYHNSFNFATAGGFTVFINNIYPGISLKNNSFGNSGTSYAVTFKNPPTGIYLVESDYNNFYTTGASLMRVHVGAIDYPSLASWRAAYPLVEKNSTVYRPGYTSSSNAQPNVNDSASWILNGRGTHVGVLSDFNGNARPATPADGVPDVGAYEFTPAVAPPVAVPSGAPVAGGTQSFTFGGDTVARILWDSGTIVPVAVAIRQYTGTKPPNMGAPAYYGYFYDSLAGIPGSYGYTLKMKYKDSWLGTLPNEISLRATRSSVATMYNWQTDSMTLVDTSNNILTVPNLHEFGLFSASHLSIPVPVKLMDFNALLSGKDVVVNWFTASEQHADKFIIERSTNLNRVWQTVGELKAAGNTATFTNYQYKDLNGAQLLSANHILYYRLRIVDMDSRVEYSKTVTVVASGENESVIRLFPNPLTRHFVLHISDYNGGEVQVTISDMNAKIVLSQLHSQQTITINEMEEMPHGVYHVKVVRSSRTDMLRLIKN